jgi:hypothetical protein
MDRSPIADYSLRSRAVNHQKGRKPPRLFLRKDLLDVGQVVLMQGNELKSSVIAMATEGRFSHAALVIAQDGFLQLFDSLDIGVGIMFMSATATGEIDREFVELVEIAGVSSLAVYRHPLIRDIDPAKIASATESLIATYSGKQYSRHERLPGTLQRLRPLTPVIAPVFRAFDRRRFPESVYGPFCSELVMLFFEKLGLHVFNDRTSADKVAPSYLARSRLVEVKGAAVAEHEVADLVSYRDVEQIHDHRKSDVSLRTALAQVQEANNSLTEQSLKMQRDVRHSMEAHVQAALIRWQQAEGALNALIPEAQGVKGGLYLRLISSILAKYGNAILSLKQFMSIAPDKNMHQNIQKALRPLGIAARSSGRTALLNFLLEIRTSKDWLVANPSALSPSDEEKYRRSMRTGLQNYKKSRKKYLEMIKYISRSQQVSD